jgi:Autotransporter beta-domain/Autochaperone Domain Type 1
MTQQNSWTQSSFVAALLTTVSALAISGGAQAACVATAGADACELDSTNVVGAPVNALTAADSLKLTGPAGFNFNVSQIAANLSALVKDGTSAVNLTGAAGFASNWVIDNGVLRAMAGNTIANGANLTTTRAGAVFGHLVLNTGDKALGALANAGRTTLGEAATALYTVTNFAGGSAAAPGELAIDVRFDLAGAPSNTGTTHDRLVIGGAATGVTEITVSGIPTPPNNPAATTGDGVQIISIAGNSAAGAFRLAGPVLQGGFQYLLERVGANNAPANYFLQSAVREELHANAVALAASRTAVRAMAFADRGVEAAEGIGAKIRAWLTVHGGTEQAGQDTGTRFNSDFWGVTAGVDTGFTSNVRVGVQGGYGQTNADIFLRQGTPGLDGDTWFGQVYAQFVSGQWFADASVGYASTEWEMRRAILGGKVSETVDGVIGKIGGGYRIEFDEPFAVTVAGHVMYDGTSCGDNCFLSGNREETSDWFGKLSVRFERPYNDGKLRPYLQVSYTDDFDDGNAVRFGQAAAFANTSSSLLGLNAGLAMDVAPNMHLFVDAGLTQGLDNDVKGYQGQAGFRMTW